MPLYDRHIREALHATVVSELLQDDPEGFPMDEFGLCQHRARVDIAVFNGALHGFEIKSDYDTLDRLEGQAEVYNATLDTVTVVVGRTHLEHVLDADFVPDWWGVIVADVGPTGESILSEVRATGTNPAPDPFRVAQLLWRDEALSALERRGRDHGVRTKSRYYVWRRLADVVPLDELRGEVRELVKLRGDWRAG